MSWLEDLVRNIMGRKKKNKKRKNQSTVVTTMYKQKEQKEDVIKDNSGKMAFLYKLDDPKYKELSDILLKKGYFQTFTEIKTLEDVRRIVTEKDYYAWDEMWIGCSSNTESFPTPKEDVYGFDRSGINKDPSLKALEDSVIWEVCKYNYEPVVGYAYACVNANKKKGSVEEFDIIQNFRNPKVFHLPTRVVMTAEEKDLKPGICYSADPDERVFLNGQFKSKFIFLYGGGESECRIAAVYSDDYLDFCGISSNINEYGLDLDPDGRQVTWDYFIDKSSVTKASPEEINKLNSALRKSGLIISWMNGKCIVKLDT